MTNKLFNYPLDLTGRSFTNRVVNEAYKIGLVRGRMFATKGGPFYGNTCSLYDIDTGRELVPKVDYKLLHYYQEATDRADQPVYAAIQIVNSDVSENVGATLQYVGGEFSWSYEAIADAIKSLEEDGRPVYWGELVGVPSEWNPTHHLHDIRNAYGWKSVAFAIARLEDAILKGSTASMGLLTSTVDAKLRAIDLWLGDGLDIITQVTEDMDVRFEEYDLIVKGYVGDVLRDINSAIKPIMVRNPLHDITPNNRYDLHPLEATSLNWLVGLTIPSETLPKDGDYIEIRAVRDGCVISINALNSPITYVEHFQGVRTLKTNHLLKDIKVGSAGVRLIWDSRSSMWQLITQLDPSSLNMDKNHLNEITTDGHIDMSLANSFILEAKDVRVIALLNTPIGRTINIQINVQGNGLVFWPEIKWTVGAPILGATSTLVTLHHSNNKWYGQYTAIA